MILVTGGTGVVGRALVSTLVERKHRVAVLTRKPTTLAGVEVRRGDLLDPGSLVAALSGITTIVHLAAALPAANLPAETVRRINVEGSANLARAAGQGRAARFIHASSAGVYGDGMTLAPHRESSPATPTTVYEMTKLEGEQTVIAALAPTPVSWLILRPTGVFGPGRLDSARFYRRVARRPVWIHGPATVIVHPLYVADLVSAVILALGRTDLNGRIFNVAGPRALTYPQLIELVASRLGVRAPQHRLPARLTRSVAIAGLGIARRLGRRSPRLERLAQPVINRSLDITLARELLGFEPPPLEASIDATIAWARRERLL